MFTSWIWNLPEDNSVYKFKLDQDAFHTHLPAVRWKSSKKTLEKMEIFLEVRHLTIQWKICRDASLPILRDWDCLPL